MNKTLIAFTLACSVATVWSTATHAFDPVNDDTDLFLANPAYSSVRPNVLIFLDNTANWNSRFDNEKLALSKVFTNLSDSFNVGLMMYTETGSGNGGPDGGYVRAGVRQMTASNRLAMAALITSFDKVGDRGNNATVSLAMHEIYAYFAGVSARSGIEKRKRDHTGNSIAGLTASNNVYAQPGNALRSSAATNYTSPITDGCQRNILIFISNGAPNDNNSSLSQAQGLLSGLVGKNPPDTIAINPSGQQNNWADEYARFMASSDVNTTLAGDQHVTTYTVEIDPVSNGQGPATTALFKSMANQGNGKYFAVNGGDSRNIEVALNQIFQEIQAVNSVYAAVALPVSANVKGTHLNQVYVGVFRPDANKAPDWFGNLKMYKLGFDTGTSSLFLADAKGVAAENPASGFVTPTATSFWSAASSFWSYRTAAENSAGGGSDAPDGELVEKGGAAQQLRIDYAASQASRKLFTCTAAGGAYCVGGAALSATPFADSNSEISSVALGVASAQRADLINWVRGQDQFDENANTQTSDSRASMHGDVLHSSPAVVNFGRNGKLDENDVYVFYGSNDGVFRAVKGGTGADGGTEVWGFIPRELFGKLNRLRDGAPAISSTSKKPYFVDGSVSVYQKDANNDGKLIAADGDKVYIYLSMRRGGRFLYALDVTNPEDPTMLWRKDNTDTGYSELGQTWSAPTVANVAAFPNPVLIMGAGYDAAVEDVTPCLITASNSSSVTWISGGTVTYTAAGGCTVSGGAATTTTRTLGRGVMVIDAFTGDLLWQAGASVSGANENLTVAGMRYSISSDVAVIDSKDIGYVGDNGGNMWRLNLSASDPANWTVDHIGSVGGNTAATRRKLQYPPDVVFGNDGSNFSAVLFGSGDREHPFDATVTNAFYMIKDRGLGTTTLDSDLFDATAATGSNAYGYKIGLASGEKAISSVVTISGITYFNTNQPSSSAAAGVCGSNLGIARQYEIDYLTAAAANTTVADTEVTARASVYPGGGYLPSPVPVLLRLDGKNHFGVIMGTSVKTPPKPTLDVRSRTFWSIKAR